jgi:hypothetical protein
MSQSFEDAMKDFAKSWANSGGSHSDDVVEGLFDILIEYFPNWSPDDKETQAYINFVKKV